MFVAVADQTTVRLAEVYCTECHLATRADQQRCLHCGKLLVIITKQEEVVH